MSASIYWRPLSDRPRHIDVSAPSSFIAKMTKIFGEPPWKLTERSLERLRVMADLNDDGARENPFERIIEEIERSGADGIELWPEY